LFCYTGKLRRHEEPRTIAFGDDTIIFVRVKSP
jgi:hypothetical protein